MSAPEEVLFELIKSKCILTLLYGEIGQQLDRL